MRAAAIIASALAAGAYWLNRKLQPWGCCPHCNWETDDPEDM